MPISLLKKGSDPLETLLIHGKKRRSERVIAYDALDDPLGSFSRLVKSGSTRRLDRTLLAEGSKRVRHRILAGM